VGRQAGPKIALALEDVGNPHNLGDDAQLRAFRRERRSVAGCGFIESGAAVRTAEGGAARTAITGDSVLEALDAFRKAGYAIVTTSSHKGTPLFSATLPKKMVLVLGQERDGLPMLRLITRI
jgi:TrmH RNA methyltransferase